MRYALNVTPINGWETHLGQGQADAALSVDGAGRLTMHAPADPAGMALAGLADGLLGIVGAGQADQALTATGASTAILKPVGGASMALEAEGTGYAAFFTTGQAEMALDGIGQLIQAILSTGGADMLMAGTAGIPQPILIPDLYSQAHPSRFFVADPGDRRIDAGNPTDPVMVSPDQRTLEVPAERSVA